MRTHKISQVGILATLAFLTGGCGDDSTNRFPRTVDRLDGFRVVFSNPGFNAELVPLNSPIQVQMNEPIDPASVAGSVTVNETIGSDSNDITQDGTLIVQNGSMLVFTLKRALLQDARYVMTLTPALRSVSGRNLIAQTIVPFCTGLCSDFLGFGTLSVAGPPVVKNIDVYQDFYVCLGFIVEFNEDLVGAPQAKADICIAQSCGSLKARSTLLYASPIYQNDLHTYWLNFPDLGCQQPDLFDAFTRVHVEVTSAVDRSGERLKKTGAADEDFDTPGDYLPLIY